MYCFRENSNFPFSNQKIITLAVIITIDQMEKSRVKGKTPTLKSKYRLGTLRMSKPVPEIYIYKPRCVLHR